MIPGKKKKLYAQAKALAAEHAFETYTYGANGKPQGPWKDLPVDSPAREEQTQTDFNFNEMGVTAMLMPLLKTKKKVQKLEETVNLYEKALADLATAYQEHRTDVSEWADATLESIRAGKGTVAPEDYREHRFASVKIKINGYPMEIIYDTCTTRLELEQHGSELDGFPPLIATWRGEPIRMDKGGSAYYDLGLHMEYKD